MGWRYKAGLGMIGALVLIWVTAAEVTQKIFTEYRQPFALTYSWISQMVVYLPIAFFSDWVYRSLGGEWVKNIYGSNGLSKTLPGLEFPLGACEIPDYSDGLLNSYLMADVSLNQAEAGQPLSVIVKEPGRRVSEPRRDA